MKTTITLDTSDLCKLIFNKLDIPQTASVKFLLTNKGQSNTTIFEGIEISMHTDVIPPQKTNYK